jgi:hypothetical protein
MSFNSFNNDSENNYDDLLKKLQTSLYSWHDEISSEIDQSTYIKDMDELMIDVEIYKDFILSILIYQEMICEASGIAYIQEIQAKYSLLDIFKIINSLINKNQEISKKDLIIFSVLLFKDIKKGTKFKINLNQITNKIHPIISMIFYNELNKKIKDLGLKKNINNKANKNFIIEDLAQIVQRKIKEDFIFTK